MVASQFISSVETTYDCAFVDQDGRLQVMGLDRVPSHVQQAIAAHRDDLYRYLKSGQDVELRPLRGQHELRRLGFGQAMDLGGAWIHPDGDAAGDAVIFGLLDPGAVAQDVEDRNARLRRMALGLGYRPTTPGSRIWKET